MFDVFVDSGANLPATQVEKYGIKVIPFISRIGEEEIPGYIDGLSLEEEREKGKAYYNRIREGAVVKTSLVNSENFADAFRPSLDDGKDILYISLSCNISGTFNAARLAAEDLSDEYPDKKIVCVDSLNASLAQGILAIYAVIMQREGKSIEEIEKILLGYVPKMNGVFTVGDLKYLERSGRVSKATRIIGNALEIKPLLKGNEEGFIVVFKKCRGRKRALDAIIKLVSETITNPEEQIIGIAHADAYEDSLYVMEGIEKNVKVKEFINTTYDYCTGAHVGPDTIALFYMAEDRSTPI